MAVRQHPPFMIVLPQGSDLSTGTGVHTHSVLDESAEVAALL
jgi:hypothetical protein